MTGAQETQEPDFLKKDPTVAQDDAPLHLISLSAGVPVTPRCDDVPAIIRMARGGRPREADLGSPRMDLDSEEERSRSSMRAWIRAKHQRRARWARWGWIGRLFQ